MINLTVYALFILFNPYQIGSQDIWKVVDGNVRFLSEAPLETIEASTDQIKGILVPSERTFAFSIDNLTFQGFNSPLQRQHFFENYIETHKYAASTFTGKIIEELDLKKKGKFEVRAKGKLSIHGISRERIIKIEIISDGGTFTAKSFFTVLLDEYDIDIPRIVHQKISEEIQIWVDVKFDMQ